MRFDSATLSDSVSATSALEVIVTKIRKIVSMPFYFLGTLMIVAGTWIVWIGMLILGADGESESYGGPSDKYDP